MISGFSGIDTAVVVLYFAATMSIGFASMRRSRTVEGFTAAERSMPGWLTGLAILGSFVSSISFLAYPGKAYAGDWNAYSWCFSMPIATIIAVKYFVPFYRRIGSVSAYENLEARFGAWARIYSDICYLLTQVARMASVAYLMALPMSILLGWNIYAVILATTAAVIIYSFVGGIIAVIWTEAIQTAVLILGAIACAAIITCSVPDGFEGVVRIAAERNKFSLGSFTLSSFAESTFFVVLLNGLFINLQNFGIDQNYVQRYITAKSDFEAKKALWLNGLVYMPLSAVFFYIGTALFCYYLANPDLLPTEYASGKPDYVFPYFMITSLPAGFKGLLVAAVFAAAMSTISCSLNSAATIILTDIYRRFAGERGRKKEMSVLRLATVALGAAGGGIALLLAKSSPENALDVWWTLSGIFSGGMLGLYLLSIATNASSRAAFWAVVSGVAAIAVLTFSGKFSILPEIPLHKFMIPVVGTSIIFAVGFAACKIAAGIFHKSK